MVVRMRWDSALALVLAGIAAIGTPFAIWSLVLAYRADRRSTELRDVAWFAQLIDGEWTFTHSGSSPARSVTIVFTVDGVASVEKLDVVEVDVPVPVSNPEHTRLYGDAREIDERDRIDEEEYDRKTVSGVFTIPIPPPMPRPAWEVRLSAVITWVYPSGQADRQAWSWVAEY